MKTLKIPVPVHPTEQILPRSDIRLKLCGGEVVEILGMPIQGWRTWEALVATFEIWKPTSVVMPDSEENNLLPFYP